MRITFWSCLPHNGGIVLGVLLYGTLRGSNHYKKVPPASYRHPASFVHNFVVSTPHTVRKMKNFLLIHLYSPAENQAEFEFPRHIISLFTNK